MTFSLVDMQTGSNTDLKILKVYYWLIVKPHCVALEKVRSANCRNLVGNLTKLERVIAAQDKMVKAMDLSTIEYRTEKADLELLVAAREAVLQAQ